MVHRCADAFYGCHADVDVAIGVAAASVKREADAVRIACPQRLGAMFAMTAHASD